MATMAAVDLGAQSGRVAVGRFDGERLARRGGAPLRERAGRGRGHAALGHRAAAPRRARRPPRGRARRRRSTRVAVDSWAVDFGLRRPRGRARREPRPLPRRAARGRGAEACSRGCPRASSTSAPGSSCCRSTPSSSSPRWPRRTIRRSSAAEHAAADPRSLPPLALRQPHDRVHERDDDAVLRPGGRRLGRPTCSSASTIPARLFPEVVAARDAARRRRPTSPRHGLGDARGDRGRDARHGLGGRGRAARPAGTRSS